MMRPMIAYYLDPSQPPGHPQILARANERCFAHVLSIHPQDLPALQVYFAGYRLIALGLVEAQRQAA